MDIKFIIFICAASIASTSNAQYHDGSVVFNSAPISAVPYSTSHGSPVAYYALSPAGAYAAAPAFNEAISAHAAGVSGGPVVTSYSTFPVVSSNGAPTVSTYATPVANPNINYVGVPHIGTHSVPSNVGAYAASSALTRPFQSNVVYYQGSAPISYAAKTVEIPATYSTLAPAYASTPRPSSTILQTVRPAVSHQSVNTYSPKSVISSYVASPVATHNVDSPVQAAYVTTPASVGTVSHHSFKTYHTKNVANAVCNKCGSTKTIPVPIIATYPSSSYSSKNIANPQSYINVPVPNKNIDTHAYTAFPAPLANHAAAASVHKPATPVVYYYSPVSQHSVPSSYAGPVFSNTDASSSVYGTALSAYPTAAPAYATAAPIYATATPAYATEAPAYATAAPAYATATPGYATAPPTYVSSPAYATAAPAYATAAPGYATAAPAYVSSPAYATAAPVYATASPAYASAAPAYSPAASAYGTYAVSPFAKPAVAYSSAPAVSHVRFNGLDTNYSF